MKPNEISASTTAFCFYISSSLKPAIKPFFNHCQPFISIFAPQWQYGSLWRSSLPQTEQTNIVPILTTGFPLLLQQKRSYSSHRPCFTSSASMSFCSAITRRTVCFASFHLAGFPATVMVIFSISSARTCASISRVVAPPNRRPVDSPTAVRAEIKPTEVCVFPFIAVLFQRPDFCPYGLAKPEHKIFV